MGRVGIGQVILGVRDLDRAAARLEAAGVTVAAGGVHPLAGTENRIVALGDAYFELLAVADRDVARTSPTGKSLLERTADGDRLVRWSIRTTGIDGLADSLGLDVERRSRRRPDGVELTWRAAGIALALEHPWLPFFVQWDDDALFPGRPADGAPNGSGITRLAVSTPDRARLARWIAAADAEVPLDVVDGAGAIESVVLTTPTAELVVEGDGNVEARVRR
jgi:catechol 2,3-dioxygenase-like lactoylglutathione lyase family enzyme